MELFAKTNSIKLIHWILVWKYHKSRQTCTTVPLKSRLAARMADAAKRSGFYGYYHRMKRRWKMFADDSVHRSPECVHWIWIRIYIHIWSSVFHGCMSVCALPVDNNPRPAGARRRRCLSRNTNTQSVFCELGVDSMMRQENLFVKQFLLFLVFIVCARACVCYHRRIARHALHHRYHTVNVS